MMPGGAVVEPIADRYEALRRGALGAASEAAPGLGMLLRRGVWAWARLAAPPAGQKLEPSTLTIAPAHPHAQRTDLARLLAGMALAHPLPQGATT